MKCGDDLNRTLYYFLKASGHEKKSEELKSAILQNCNGKEGVELFNTFNLPD